MQKSGLRIFSLQTVSLGSYLLTTNPVQSLGNQAEAPSGGGTGVFEVFFFGRMPKKNRITLKRLTSRSYRAMIRAKETKAMIRYFGPMPIFQRMTNQPTQRIIV
jgi:hypothetical protein